MSSKSKSAEAKAIAKAVAKTMFEDFGDPSSDNRGPNFVWPETYIDIVSRWTILYSNHLKLNKTKLMIMGRQAAIKFVLANPQCYSTKETNEEILG